MNGKIKASIAAAALAAGSVAIVGGHASAATNTGGYQQSSEAHHQQVCDTLYSYFAQDVNSAETAQKAGNTKSMLDFLDLASNDLNAAKNYGCDWAQRTAPPTLGQAPTPATSAGALR